MLLLYIRIIEYDSITAELTLMLYEGNKILQYCNYGIREEKMIKAHKNIIKAQRIIMELRATLDFKYPPAVQFELVYDYIYRRLIQGNIKKDKEIIEEALGYIREMRDTWKEVMRLTK